MATDQQPRTELPQEAVIAQESRRYFQTMALLVNATFSALTEGCQCPACNVLRSNAHHLKLWLQRLTDLGVEQ